MYFRSLQLLLVASLSASIAACGGSTTSSTSSSSGSPEAPRAASMVGIYHLEEVDATNLEILANGSYQWTIEGCDFGGGQCGRWTDDGTKLVLSREALEWSYDGSFQQRLRALTITKSGDDVAVAGITINGQSFTQTWKKGRSCAICGGQLGPTGQETCATPLPEMCGDD